MSEQITTRISDLSLSVSEVVGIHVVLLGLGQQG
ncbi:uncharacterized protein METZ01_LOCUS196148 [marine metagenome]|uniref:Uncharacterized protein n=1 Tax=marine metagenome TaxID=408172 RepID=A0A382DZH6_9ZZZZ